MPNSILSPDFLDKQVEKLNAFKAQNPDQVNVIDNPGGDANPASIPNGHKEAVKELIQNASKPDQDSTIEEPATKAGEKEGQEDGEKQKEIAPPQKRVDLDTNKAKGDRKEIDPEIEAHKKWLEEDEAKDGAINESKKEEKPNYEEEIKSYKNKVQEYESVLNDDLIKAVVEYRKSGGSDLNELNDKLGIVDANKLTIEDFYSQKATEQGLKGDELKEAVDEAVDRYNALPKLDQAEILNTFKNTLKSKTEEKLKSFSVQSQRNRQEQERIESSAYADIKNQVNELVGKKWRGLLIDEKMSKEILEVAHLYALPIPDGNGRIVGYDTKLGVRLAILDKYEKKLMKTQYDLAKVSAYDEVINERNRPSENMTSNQIVANVPNDIERITKQMREEKEKQRNRGRS